MGDSGAGSHQQVAGKFDNPLVRPAARGRGKSAHVGGDVRPDDCEVAIGHFPNVRTAIQGGGFCTVSMWIRSNAALKDRGFHSLYVAGIVPTREHVPKREHVKHHVG